jgi:N-acyl-L-homoserine lactone synthetase
MPQLLCGLQEFFRQNGVEAAVGVTRQHLLEHFLPGRVRWLGPAAEIEGEQEAAFWVPTEHLRPHALCLRYGIPDRVLSAQTVGERIAA